MDTVITKAAVHTMDPTRSRADAVAIRGGRIAAVGSETEVVGLAGPATRRVELPGCVVLPAFQDAHVHPIHGGLASLRCDLYDIWGKDDYLEAIGAYARRHPDSEWILGGGWAMDAFERGAPSTAGLDDVVPDRPVYLTSRDYHSAWVNSKALDLAAVTRDTPEPADGRIERDERGEPRGTLHEGAMDLVGDLAPQPGHDELVDALRAAQQHLHSLGIGSWQDAWVGARELEAYRSLADEGGLSGRAVLSLVWDRHRGEEQLGELEDQRALARSPRIEASTVKFFQDGVAENRTAAMLEPYLDEAGAPTGNRGISMIEPERLKRLAALVDAAGFQLHFHAIGDRAVRESLDAIEAAQAANGRRDARHHIAHLQVVDPDDMPRFDALGAVATAQPLWACEDGYMRDLTIPFLGPTRAMLQYPLASLLRAGAPLAFGSDWPVSSPDPLAQVEVATTRVCIEDRGAASFLPGERLSLTAAVTAGTAGSAFVNHLDDITGSIETGKCADLAVLDRDVFDPRQGPVGDARVLMTLVDGRPVHLDPVVPW